MTYSENYLAHYGVKGMKWGVRKRIEQIPQGIRNRKKSYAIKGRNGMRKVDSYRHGQMQKWKAKSGSEKAKTVLKVAGGVAIAGLAVYGGSKAIDQGKHIAFIMDYNKDVFNDRNTYANYVNLTEHGQTVNYRKPNLNEKLGLKYTTADGTVVRNRRPQGVSYKDVTGPYADAYHDRAFRARNHLR